MAKILFTDLDGTLLTDDKKISSKNKEAIQKMLHQGNYFVICTGRPVASGRIVAKELLSAPERRRLHHGSGRKVEEKKEIDVHARCMFTWNCRDDAPALSVADSSDAPIQWKRSAD